MENDRKKQNQKILIEFFTPIFEYFAELSGNAPLGGIPCDNLKNQISNINLPPRGMPPRGMPPRGMPPRGIPPRGDVHISHPHNCSYITNKGQMCRSYALVDKGTGQSVSMCENHLLTKLGVIHLNQFYNTNYSLAYWKMALDKVAQPHQYK